MEVRVFDKSVDGFFLSLESDTRGKVAQRIGLLEEFGHRLRLPYSKPIRQNFFELRIRGQQEVRIFYSFHQNVAVLLHGFIKKSQQIPLKEIGLAWQRKQLLDSI